MTMMNAGGGSGASEVMATVGLKWLGDGSPSDGPGAGPSGENGGGSEAEGRKEKRDASNNQRQQTGAVQEINTLCINIGIASILKHSQIFTGTLGTIFQILGALVDVILAPFLPIIVPAIKAMAENIPEIREKAQEIIGNIIKVVISVAKVVSAIIGFLPGSFKGVLKDIIQYWILGLFLAKLVGLHKVYMAATKGIAVLLQWGFMKLFYAITGRQAMGGAGGGGGVYPGPRSTYGGGAATRAGTTGAIARRGGGSMNMVRGAGIIGGAGLMYAGTQSDSGGTSLLAGAAGGAMIGASIGSIIPGIGTGIGAVAGGLIGAATTFAIRAANDDNEQAKRNADKFNMNHRSEEYREKKSMLQWG